MVEWKKKQIKYKYNNDTYLGVYCWWEFAGEKKTVSSRLGFRKIVVGMEMCVTRQLLYFFTSILVYLTNEICISSAKHSFYFMK